jgi:hypothetical protein
LDPLLVPSVGSVGEYGQTDVESPDEASGLVKGLTEEETKRSGAVRMPGEQENDGKNSNAAKFGHLSSGIV